MPKVPGVYVIGDFTSGKVYIGSSENLPKRLYNHDRELRAGNHRNYKLQRAFNQGHDLRVGVVPLAEGEDVRVVEKTLIDEFHPQGFTYNIALDTEAPMLGRKQSPEALEKMRAASTGKIPSEDTRALLSERAKERGTSREFIEAGAAARRGKNLTPEHVDKVRQASIERMQDPAARAISGTSMKNKQHSPDSIAKMKAAAANRRPSPQALEARRQYYENLRLSKASGVNA